MIVLLQRVTEAAVYVADESVAVIGAGLLALIAIEPQDNELICERMAKRLLAYRIFNDQQGQMNLNVREVQGEILAVSQFTLAADTRKGLRPGFSTAAQPQVAEQRFDRTVASIKAQYAKVKTGRFGAHMQVHLVNDGPATFLLTAK